MSHTIYSAAVIGLDSHPIEVEVDLTRGLHSFAIVGLPDKVVEEAKDRVSAAIKNTGLTPPQKTNQRVVVNLAPAELKKEGPNFDLPIALAYLTASRQVTPDVGRALFIGELSLDGRIRPVHGTLSAALMARAQNFSSLFVPWENRKEAALVSGVSVYGVRSLSTLVEHLRGNATIEPTVHTRKKHHSASDDEEYEYDFSHIKGQEHVKRALEITAAGGHNVLMSGPPGSGKTLLARALTTILPAMTWNELLEVTNIHSVAGTLPAARSLVRERPFRNPHHNTSVSALIGGGTTPQPGEVTLAHHGVLLLDEVPEFSRSTLESLRQPLEDGTVTVSRVSGTASFPARIMLVATMNPCPCGFQTDPKKYCPCTPHEVRQYTKKLSGPLLDRIDMHVSVPRVQYDKLSSDTPAERSRVVRNRVEKAREKQRARFTDVPFSLNSAMRHTQIKQYCTLDEKGEAVLRQAVEQYGLSARAYHRIRKVSRTIADLAEEEQIQAEHILEALQFRLQSGEDTAELQ